MRLLEYIVSNSSDVILNFPVRYLPTYERPSAIRNFALSCVIVSVVSHAFPFLNGSPVLVSNDFQVCGPAEPSIDKLQNSWNFITAFFAPFPKEPSNPLGSKPLQYKAACNK